MSGLGSRALLLSEVTSEDIQAAALAKVVLASGSDGGFSPAPHGDDIIGLTMGRFIGINERNVSGFSVCIQAKKLLDAF